MSDQYTPGEPEQSPSEGMQGGFGQDVGPTPTAGGFGQPVPAPVEQPYYVPTPHQQAWSANQQYPIPGQPWTGTQPPTGGQPWNGGQPWAYGQYWTPPPVPTKPRHHKVLIGSVAAATATALAVGGVALAVDRSNHTSPQQSALTTPNSQLPFGQNGNGQSGNGQTSPYGNGYGFGGNGGSGSSGSGGVGGSGSSNTTGSASSAQQIGVVDINTTLDYDRGKAAGTGIVLTSGGQILTNNHVVQDSTAISVTVVSTGKTYTATVVGTDPTDDVAVIQLKNASGLSTAKLGDSSKVTAGTAVTAVGNAGGTGGTPSSATGSVTALNQSLTASDINGSNAERLTGMFEVDAAIQAGDSGGPLYDNASGSVIGIDTAASSAGSSGSRFGGSVSGATTGFAIPIAKALGIAGQITGGQASSTIHLGYPAFFGVQLSATGQGSTAGQGTSPGAAIAGVVSGSAAAQAGLQAGDTITAVDGKAIAGPTALSKVTAAHKPGDQVTVTYTDASGKSHSVSVTLGSGPAD